MSKYDQFKIDNRKIEILSNQKGWIRIDQRSSSGFRIGYRTRLCSQKVFRYELRKITVIEEKNKC
jgi:hypothetical protein